MLSQQKQLKTLLLTALLSLCGSIVRGEVIEVQRPGVNKCGFIKVKFNKIKTLKTTAKELCRLQSASASADDVKNPNFVARLLGAPFTGAGRVVGVAGRTASSMVNVAANGFRRNRRRTWQYIC